MTAFEDIKVLVGDVLELGPRTAQLEKSTGLLGTIPEFDSMTVVSLITAIEDRFGITIEDDEISAEVFETVGKLNDFVEAKLDA